MSASLEHAICNNRECPWERSVAQSVFGDNEYCPRCSSDVMIFHCNFGSRNGMEECNCKEVHEREFGEKDVKYRSKDFDNFKWFDKWHAKSVNEGWYTLLYNLCSEIDKELKRTKLPDFEVAQVKQKFGGLRFYVHGANKAIYDLIRKAEQIAFKTCELCGNKGRTRPGGWIMTLCTQHWWNEVFGKDSNPRWSVKFNILLDDFFGQIYGVSYLVSNYWHKMLRRKP